MMLHEIKKHYKTELETEEAVWKLLNKHCKDAIDHGLPIVRGMSQMDTGYGIIHGAAGKRSSANTTNHYTVILDAVLPKEFPRRSKCIIAANWKNRGHAHGYGHIHAIVPFDKVKIGICPGEDMFDTEIKIGRMVQRISRWNDFYSNNYITDESYPKLVRGFKDLLGRKDLWDIDADNLEETLAEAYTKPFKIATTATPDLYNDGEKHEVWIGGKCIAIDYYIYRSVMRNARSGTKL